MSWYLSSDSGLVAGYFVFLAMALLCYYLFGKDTKTGKTIHQQFRLDARCYIGDLRAPLNALLRSGVNGSSLVISFPESGVRIRYDKYIRAKGDYGISLILPEEDTERSPLSAWRKYCEHNDIPFNLDPDPDNPVSENAYIDCRKNLDLAYLLLRKVAIETWCLSEDAKHDYEIVNGYRAGELVDDPLALPQDEFEIKSRLFEAYRQTHGVGISEFLKLRFLQILLLLGGTGLLYATVTGVVANIPTVYVGWSSLNLTFLTVSVQIKVLDLVFIAICIIGMSQTMLRAYWMARAWDDGRQGPVTDPSDFEVSPIIAAWETIRRSRRVSVLLLFVVLTWIEF